MSKTNTEIINELKTKLQELDTLYDGVYQSPESVYALQKTIQSFNITITDWNTLLTYINSHRSSLDGLLAMYPDFVDAFEEITNNLTTQINNRVLKADMSGFYAYTHDGATQKQTPISETAQAKTLAIRDNYGRLQVATPISNNEATTKQYVDDTLLLKADKATTYTIEEVNNAIASAVSSVYRYKGTVPTYNDLPSSGLTVGDVYNVEDTGDNYAWAGTVWDKLAGTVDLSDYYTKEQADENVVRKQTNVAILVNPLTNINGKVLETYSAELVNSDHYVIKRNGNQCSIDDAIEYINRMTGTTYVPRYNYDYPRNSYWLFADGTLWKPQFNENELETMTLWKIPIPYALQSEVNTLLSAKQNTLVNQQNIKSINNESLLGSGNIDVGGNPEWGDIDGDITDQTDLQNELQDIREVAEGKNKTYILKYSETIASVKTELDGVGYFYVYNSTTKEWENKLTELVNGDYDNVNISNSAFNSQNNYVTISYGLIFRAIPQKSLSYIENYRTFYYLPYPSATPTLFKLGDIFLVVETDVPDRWVGQIIAPLTLYKLETSKVDLTNYATKTEVNAKSDLTNVAPTYDNTLTYTIGEVVSYNGKIYKCTTAITTPESWDSTHWTETSVASDFVNLTGTQTIPGSKTFTVKQTFDGGIETWQIIRQGIQRLYFDQWNATVSSRTILPLIAGDDVGSSSSRWENLYLSESIDFSSYLYFKIAGTNTYVLGVGSFQPSGDNQRDLGYSSNRWRRVYTTSLLNNNANYGITLPDMSSWTDNREIATGVKEISAPSSISLTDDEYNLFTSGSIIKINGTFLGLTNPILVLGRNNNNFYWGTAIGSSGTLENTFATYYIVVASKQIFLGGNNDRYEVLKSVKSINGVGFDSIVNGTFNVINASDIVNNTLTQEQYDLITNGKPTLIKGTLINAVDAIYIYCGNFPTNAVFRRFARSVNGGYFNERTCVINLSTKVISELNVTERLVDLQNIQAINGKTIPVYPADTTKQYKLVQQVGGNLGYVSDYAQPYATNSTTELKYETINNISISADTTYTLATAPANTYPEYKAYITNSGSSAINLTFSGVNIIKTNDSDITISSNVLTLPAGTTIEVNIQNGNMIAFNWSVGVTAQTISFTVDYQVSVDSTETFSAEEGMTWAEWVNSSYNTEEAEIYEDTVLLSGGVVADSQDTPVLPTDTIIENEVYYINRGSDN